MNEINRLFVESDPEVGYRKDNTFSGRNFFVEPTFGIKFSLCRYVALNMSIAYEWDAVMQKCQSRNPDFPSTFKVDWSGYRAQAGLIFCLNLKKMCIRDSMIAGTRQQVQGLNCAQCGFPTCVEKPKTVPCAINSVDLGIAVGSACATASDLRLDTRVMFSAGMAAQRLGMLGDCKCCLLYTSRCV